MRKIMKRVKNFLLSVFCFVWAVPFSVIGLITALILLITGHKPIKYGPAVRFEVGNNWGGLELGSCFFVTCKNPSKQLKNHETGHLLQQFMFGPLTLFIITIPSALRFWLRSFKSIKSKYIYCLVFFAVASLLFLTPLIIGLNFNILWMIILFTVLEYYLLILIYWLITIETPKYLSDTPPKYDDIWFEGDATKRGTLYMDKNYGKQYKG